MSFVCKDKIKEISERFFDISEEYVKSNCKDKKELDAIRQEIIGVLRTDPCFSICCLSISLYVDKFTDKSFDAEDYLDVYSRFKEGSSIDNDFSLLAKVVTKAKVHHWIQCDIVKGVLKLVNLLLMTESVLKKYAKELESGKQPYVAISNSICGHIE